MQAPPPLFAEEVRAVLAQQRQASAAATQPQQPQSLPAAVHFGPSSSTAGAGDDDSAAELEQLQQRVAQLVRKYIKNINYSGFKIWDL